MYELWISYFAHPSPMVRVQISGELYRIQYLVEKMFERERKPERYEIRFVPIKGLELTR